MRRKLTGRMAFLSLHWWRTVFWLIPLISVFTVLLGTLSLASVFVDRSGCLAHLCARGWSWLILATTGVRVKVTGRHLLESRRSYVFVSNHQSIYDFPILITSIPFQLRIIAKASLATFPVIGWHLRYAGHLLIDRTRAGMATLNSVAALMKRGQSLIVFPEGTRSKNEKVLTVRRGLFLLAIRSGLPIVPVAVIGSHRVMAKGRLETCPGNVEVVIHSPLLTNELGRSDARALADRARKVISQTVESH